MIEKLGPFVNVVLFFGSATIVAFIIVIITFCISAFIEWYDKKKRRYNDKHRFDKPPLGRCYCIACGKWITTRADKTMGYCHEWEKYTADNEFCGRSYLRNDQEYDIEKWRLKDMKEDSER